MKNIIKPFLFLLISLLSYCETSNTKQISDKVESKFTSLSHCDFIKKLAPSGDYNCGNLIVPENHNDSNSKKIQIAYIVLKAWKKEAGKYPLIYFSGGPGGRTLSEGRIKAWLQSPIREKRDIILFDQRGIGFSSPLPNMNQETFQIMSEDKTVLEELSSFHKVIDQYKQLCELQKIDLPSYNSFQNAQDVGLLMHHLGYKKYNLYGVSYGTRLARIIQDKYPTYLHSVILNSPSPIKGDFLIDRLKSYSLALERIFNYCENDPICQQAYPNLKNTYLEAITALNKNPIKVTVDGQPFFINAQDGLYLLRRKLYANDAPQQIPVLILALKKGSGTILKEIVQFEKRFTNAINMSMLLAVERYEAYDSKNTNDVITAHYQKLPLLPVELGFFNSLYLAGKHWHAASLSLEEKAFKLSTIPTLLTVNHYDPVTPPENGVLFQKKLPNSRLLVLDEGGHAGGNSRCRNKVMIAFMDEPDGELDTSCLNIYKEKLIK